MRIWHPLAALIGLACASATAAPLSLQQIMNFETLKNPVIADNGQWVAYVAQPDRGEPRGLVRGLDGGLWQVERGVEPMLSADGAYALFERKAPLWKQENAGKKKAGKMAVDRIMVNTATGEQRLFEAVTKADFSADGRFLMLSFKAEEAEEDKEEAKDDEAIDADKLGSRALLLDLKNGSELALAAVTHFALAREANVLVYSTSHEDGVANAVIRRALDAGQDSVLWQRQDWGAASLAIDESGEAVAFTAAYLRTEEDHQLAHQLWLGQGARPANALPLPDDGMLVTEHSKLHFSRDGQRLFVGRQLPLPKEGEIRQLKGDEDLQDIEVLRSRVALNVWHGDDPRIKTNEIKEYPKARKHNYVGVWHLEDKRFVQLADGAVPEVKVTDNPRYLLASSDRPYLKMISWAGFYQDWYLMDMESGERRLLVTQAGKDDIPSLSPLDNAVAWYVRGRLYRHDIASGNTTEVVGGPEAGFANEDHDYPSPAPGYGFGPWLANGTGVLVYDKFDIWRLDATTGKLSALTRGRQVKWQYRVIDTDPRSDLVDGARPLLVHGYNDFDKREGVYHLNLADASLKRAQQGEYKLSFVVKAEDADTLLFSKQRYDLYPDLLATSSQVKSLKPVSRLGEQLQGLEWGQAQLVHWRSNDGKPLSGVVITPPGYQGDKPLPTLVYFYRFMSQRLHHFPQMALNHRPNFAQYVNDGYAVFLPDIRFEVGHPGQSSLASMLPGVQKVIDLGIAQAGAIGIQGHSWAGYQDAYLITQTDIFAAAVSGAPVSNMTSAYGGIRLGSGLTRQFQYESGQSRIGKTLMEAPHLYVENSPIFHVDRIDTPLVIMFGDEDDAVPYPQGIELYMAMRRAGKAVVMLQYEGEPHHLKKYPNKLDYSVKMKQFFDHYLKGAPVPKWWSDGVPYLKRQAEE
ncbi:S9 family peptidase [Ferrimonas sediminicola]|uniref:S9 family peptidase n=1 Tax=Ferrimonas sediminicola TaxID=2569538 RepID=A0A4U1BEZ4_9GAMM|nr:prolyl oligopeptidase family serine peptidase [Ferrimonas sediminicola]TKB49455.1 S9 family peptidase [Ferrimonas sediminicola]